MADADKPKKPFRWFRFLLTFGILCAIVESGSRKDSAEAAPSLRVAEELGRVLGALALALIIYKIDSWILARRRRKSAGPGE